MSPVLRQRARAERSAAVILHDGPVPARVHPWPGDPLIAQLVLLDSAAVPTAAHFTAWIEQLAVLGFQTVRTGALAPRPAAQAELAGMHCVQELALLEALAPFTKPHRALRTRRAQPGDFERFADIDRDAFGDRWGLGAPMLRDVLTATPIARARAVRGDVLGRAHGSARAERVPVGFLLSGRSGRTGYIQRLAVQPAVHRSGVGAALLCDALAWFSRSHCDRAMVNTDVVNEPALALYRRHGFTEMAERLRVFERATAPV